MFLAFFLSNKKLKIISNKFYSTFTRSRIATGIAILFHLIGFTGIIFFDRSLFIRLSAVNILLMLVLLFYSRQSVNKRLILFAAVCFITGFVVETWGTRTGAIFGDYIYGTALGPAVMHVPLIVGVNWFIIIYCAGITVQTILNKMLDNIALRTDSPKPVLKALSVIVDGATLAVLFDWLMEPVAIKLGYWQWKGNSGVPFYNYVSWFIVSALLLSIFHYAKFEKQNKFAVNLLLIQGMFFLLLRTFL